MRVVFRVDASTLIGTGHVVRCLVLAQALLAAGAECQFIMRLHPGHLAGRIESAGFPLATLPPPADAVEPEGYAAWRGVSEALDAQQTAAVLPAAVDWLVVDHYGLDDQWERALRPRVRRLMVIDDLQRAHDCDLLLDQNRVFGEAPAAPPPYAGRVPAGCQVLVGPRYALLGADYAAPFMLPDRSLPAARVLVYFGGSDLTGETAKVLAALYEPDLHHLVVDLVAGSNQVLDTATEQRLRQHSHWRLHRAVPTLAPLMRAVDLAVGAGGTTTWERLCLGLPAVVTAVAPNQEPGARALAARGLIEYLGTPAATGVGAYAAALRRLLGDPARRRAMAAGGRALVDGHGTARVVAALLGRGAPLRLRPLGRADLEAVRQWRNAPSVRRFMFTRHEIQPDEHQRWFERLQGDPTACWMVAEEADGRPMGVTGFSRIGEGTADWGFYARPGAPPGTGTRLGQASLAWAFGPLGLRQLRGEVLADNVASLRLFRRLGFVERGVLREVRIGGAAVGVHGFEIDAATWQARRQDASPGEA